MVLLVVARFLIARIAFGRWRASLGRIASGNKTLPASSQRERAMAEGCGHAVRRAARRLPGSLCLPQAMALQWMLRRRGVPATLLMGVAGHGARHGALGDLHAWVEMGGAPLLDDGGGCHRVVLRLATDALHCNIDPASEFE